MAMDKDLRSDQTLDCFCSGSTSVVVLKMGMDLLIGNIGDSRAILGTKEGSSMVAVQLTVDLKPDLPREAERIKQCRGRVFALQDEPEVPRVWLPFDNAPGLAMARAFGDFCLKNYGVISDPDFSHWVLTDRDQFVVLASDGVWDVVSNQEAVDIISSAPTRSSAAKCLVEAATREWKLKYPTSRMDDCAVVCLYLNATGMDCKSASEEDTCATPHLNDKECISDVQRHEPSLDRNFTVRSVGSGKTSDDSVDQDWSGLEGVTRANSIVQLPRFSDEVVNG